MISISIIILIIFVLLADYIWLTTNKQMYSTLVKSIQKQEMKINIIGAIVSYICVILLLVFYAIPFVRLQSKTNKIPSIQSCVIYGGGMGLLAYAIFNFTNIGIFKNYNVKTALIDTLWGGILFSISTILYFYVFTQQK